MLMTPAQQSYVARRAQWYWDIKPISPDDHGDWTVFTGDGIDDLDSTAMFIERYPRCKIRCEVGTPGGPFDEGEAALGNEFPQWVEADLEDVYAVKSYYMAYYGTVNKPPWVPPTESAVKLPLLSPTI